MTAEFEETLELGLKINVQGQRKPHDIPTGDIKGFDLDIRPYGFKGRIRFWITNEQQADPFFNSFVSRDLLEIQFDLQTRLKPEVPPEPIQVQGIVTTKAILAEQISETVKIKKQPVLYRLYEITFADPAQVLWHNHFPCDLLVDQTMKQLIEAHKGDGVAVTCDWDVLEKEHAVITLPLGSNANTASFYDFICGYVSRYNGVFVYDTYRNQYSFLKSKPAGSGIRRLDKLDVAGLRIGFPETMRYDVQVGNAAARNPKTKSVGNEDAHGALRRDVLKVFDTEASFNTRCALENQKLRARCHELRIEYARFPHVDCCPHTLIEIKGGQWSKKIYPHGGVYRIRDLVVSAQSASQEVTAKQHMPYAPFQMRMKTVMETRDETWVTMPNVKPVAYPLLVEGKVLSEVENEDVTTYQIYKDRNSADVYRVAVPFWEDRQVVVPFEPSYATGHFYFPAYKNARVQLALECHSARIVAFLDWHQGARLPGDSQGNRILVGKTENSRTTLSHVYTDAKPEFTIKRTSEKDTQTITVKEGVMILETKEE